MERICNPTICDIILFQTREVNGLECLAHILKLNQRNRERAKGTTENSFKMMKHVSMDVLYFSAYSDFSLHIGHTVEQPCVDVAD